MPLPARLPVSTGCQQRNGLRDRSPFHRAAPSASVPGLALIRRKRSSCRCRRSGRTAGHRPRPRPPGSAAPATMACMKDQAAPAATNGITSLCEDVYQIDTQMAGYTGITAGYLIRSERPCLVETGTAPSAPVVRDALAQLGVGPADLATIVVTHIHLDHAGGVGDLAEMFPAAEIVVHELGARHLADPSRLMASARLVYGDELDALFGVLAPTPAERIRAVEQTGVVDLGGGRR